MARFPHPIRWSMWRDLLAGVSVPVVILALLGSGESLGPSWQSGNLFDFWLMFLNAPSLLPFVPLLLLSLLCVVLIIVQRERFERFWLIRFGVYTGVVLSGQIALIATVPLWLLVGGSGWYVSILIGVNQVCLVLLICGLAPRRWMLAIFGAWLGVMLLEETILFTPRDVPFASLGLQLPGLIVTSPWFATATFARYSWQLLATRTTFGQFRLLDLFGLVTWLGAYLGAWRAAYLAALEAYAALPKTDDCYVCTAAARGHRCLVGAWEVSSPDGRVLRVNRQMQRLKAAEIALRVLSPIAHAGLRALYDRVGPRLAARMSSAWRADGAYLLLKPAEWMAAAILHLLVDEHVSRLYREARDR